MVNKWINNSREMGAQLINIPKIRLFQEDLKQVLCICLAHTHHLKSYKRQEQLRTSSTVPCISLLSMISALLLTLKQSKD